jgi:ubiquinone/menaquinone biosynthesis C-methylase UbiE
MDFTISEIHLGVIMKRGNTANQQTRAPDAEANKIDMRNEIQEQYGKQAIPWFCWVFDALDLPKGSRLLELGSGTGTFWQENKARMPAGWKILLTDQDADMVQSAKANLAAFRRKFRFTRTDSQAIPFPSESFDAVLAIGLLDLVPDLQQALSEIWRVLRPSGTFIATAGGKGHLQEMEELLRVFIPAQQAEQLGGSEERFGLENGEGLLAPFFEDIVRRGYNDRMVFTELQPILNYMFSERGIIWSMPLDKLGVFVHQVKLKLAQKGSLEVTVRKGLFTARKKNDL